MINRKYLQLIIEVFSKEIAVKMFCAQCSSREFESKS